VADDVAITAGSGTTVGADERTINAVAVKVQRMVVEGGSDFVTGQVTPTASAATLVAARETRKNVVFYNGTNLDVFVGPATVTTANGFRMPPGSGLTITTTKLIQNIVASVTGLTGVVYYCETFDA
jgi:hypothetical protein